MLSSLPSETPFCQTAFDPALYQEFPLIALFSFAGPLLTTLFVRALDGEPHRIKALAERNQTVTKAGTTSRIEQLFVYRQKVNRFKIAVVICIEDRDIHRGSIN